MKDDKELIPDLTDPRYLREIGWFLRYEKSGPFTISDSFDEERRAFSELLLTEVLDLCTQEREWILDKTVVSLGCGCTGDLTTWPAATKVGIDPLINVYQRLKMIAQDNPDTSRTVYLSVVVEELPLLDDWADLVICRNALDHMLNPESAIEQAHRILKEEGFFYLNVDIGGAPTPDEPIVFSKKKLVSMIEKWFRITTLREEQRSFSGQRNGSVRILGSKRGLQNAPLDKKALLQSYIDQFGDEQP